MACEVRFLAFHVHGHEWEIEQFFEAIEDALDKLEETAQLLWPSLTFHEAETEDE